MAKEGLQKSRQEIEPIPHHPILILGAGQGTGAEIARKFALEGLPVIIGTRSPDKFSQVRDRITQDGGRQPEPFIADITDPHGIHRAYESLHIPAGSPIHFFPLAAGGLNVVGDFIFKQQVIPLRKLLRSGKLSVSHVRQATEEIKSFVQRAEIIKSVLNVNYDGTLGTLKLLENNGHLGPDSTVATLSSVISNSCNPYDRESYQGPWFYYPVAHSKQLAVLELQDRAQKSGFHYVDFVAPEIEGTDVAKLIEKMKPLLDFARETLGLEIINFPKVTKTEVADSMYQEFKSNDHRPRVRTVFLEESGKSSDIRPVSWDQVLESSIL